MANGNGNGNGKKKGAGRPPGSTYKCTVERTQKIAALIAAGQTQRAAAEANSISNITLSKWLQKGADPKGAPCYKEFRRQIEQARNLAEMRIVKVVTDAIAMGNLQAAMYWLRCRRPKDWSPEQRLRHAGDADNPVEVKHSGSLMAAIAGDAEAVEIVARLAERLAQSEPESGEPGD